MGFWEMTTFLWVMEVILALSGLCESAGVPAGRLVWGPEASEVVAALGQGRQCSPGCMARKRTRW